jgi:hypothetical protein
MPVGPSSAGTDRSYLTALGLVAQNYPREGAQAGTILISGTVYYLSIGLTAGQTVSKLWTIVNVVGNTVTASKLGLYSKSAALLGATADLGTAWQSTGVISGTLATPVLIATSDLYYVGIFATASVTMPTMLRDSAQGAGAAAISPGVRPFGNQTGQSDLPNPGTVGGSAPAAYWVGAS